ncbi:restriction endonuclease subunit S [Citrobacter sp. Cpo065]|nr:restriction endonuclease subunit S [Citrobacter sp. Cpo065]MDM2851529.1 restriction endonuclease subunit S [Citrobacter sp. Cpo065]
MKTNKSQNLKSIPTGYKQTEVGIIPEDWKVSSIGDLCVIFGRIGFRGYTKADIVSQDQGVLSISPSNIFDGRTNFTHGTYITRQKYEESPEIKIYEDDILLVKTGSTYGKIALVKNLKEDATLNPQVVVFKRLKSPAAFLAYIMQSDIVQNQIEETIVGGAIPTLSQKVVLSYKIPLPTPREQLAIANVLSDTDALIIAIEQLIAKKKDIKTATMQQLLTGRTRLPQFAKHPDGVLKGNKPSELGLIPEDWICVKLGEIGQCIIGLTYSPRDVSDTGTLVLRSSNVQNNKLAYQDNVFVNMDLPERVIVRKGDILICVRNGSRKLIGKCALIDHAAEGCAFGAFMAIYRTKAHDFIFYQFQSNLIHNQIDETMGATINQITNKDLSGFIISMPSCDQEQTAIATILLDMDAELEALEQKLAKIRDIKQGMIQQLLTGRIRLPLEQQP